MPIKPFLKDDHAFDQSDITAMSIALEDVCKVLNVNGSKVARETIALRIIELAGRGERRPEQLRDRVLAEANGGARL